MLRGMYMDDELVAKYAAEAKAAMEAEASRRVAEVTDPEEEERLRNLSLGEIVNRTFCPGIVGSLGTRACCS